MKPTTRPGQAAQKSAAPPPADAEKPRVPTEPPKQDSNDSADNGNPLGMFASKKPDTADKPAAPSVPLEPPKAATPPVAPPTTQEPPKAPAEKPAERPPVDLDPEVEKTLDKAGKDAKDALIKNKDEKGEGSDNDSDKS